MSGETYRYVGEMLDRQILREGDLSSFMIRAGLLREILDRLARSGDGEEVARLREALEKAKEVISLFKDQSLFAEGVHAGLRKGTDASDAHHLWTAIANSRTSAWGDAIGFAIDPYFTMWGGNDALLLIEDALALRGGKSG